MALPEEIKDPAEAWAEAKRRVALEAEEKTGDLNLSGLYIERLPDLSTVTHVERFAVGAPTDFVSFSWSGRIPLRSLDGVEALLKLRFLNCSATWVGNLSPLDGLSDIETLLCLDNNVDNLRPLQHSKQLRLINFSDTLVSDLTPLKNLSKLKTLSFTDTQVSDLSPLKGLTKLNSLLVNDTQVQDLTPIKGLKKIQRLYCDRTLVGDLKPLETLHELEELWIDGSQINAWPKGLFDRLRLLDCSEEFFRKLGIENYPPMFRANEVAKQVAAFINANPEFTTGLPQPTSTSATPATAETLTYIWPEIDKANRLIRVYLTEAERDLPQAEGAERLRASLAKALETLTANAGANILNLGQDSLDCLQAATEALGQDVVDPFVIDINMDPLPEMIARIREQREDTALAGRLEAILKRWAQLRPLFPELNREFSSDMEDLVDLIAGYEQLSNWFAALPDEICAPDLRATFAIMLGQLKQISEGRQLGTHVLLTEQQGSRIAEAIASLRPTFATLEELARRVDTAATSENDAGPDDMGEGNNLVTWRERFAKAGRLVDWTKKQYTRGKFVYDRLEGLFSLFNEPPSV